MQNQTESGPKCLGGEAVVMWLMTVPASACSGGGCGDGEGGGGRGVHYNCSKKEHVF